MCDHAKSLSFVLVCILAVCSPSILLAHTDADVSVPVGGQFTVMLHDIDGVYGFWSLASSLPSWLVLIDQTWVPDDPDPTVIGGPGTAHFTFRGTGPGSTTLTFEYKYPGQDTALAIATCQVTVGTPADTEKISVTVGEQFKIALRSSPSAGYSWYLASSLPAWLELVGKESISDPAPPGYVGQPATVYFTFRATGPGSTRLTFEYMQAWIGIPEQTHTVHVTASTPADTSLVLYLPFDEGAGVTANDLSSYDNPGAIVGAAWVPGVSGTALEFDLGSHVIIPEIPAYDVTDAVSLLAWVKTTRDTFGGRVIDKSLYPTSGFDLCLTLNAGLPRFEFFVNNTSAVNGTTAVIDNEWHFIAGTFGDKTLRMYVDGRTEAEAQSVGSVDINPNDRPIMVGGETSSNGGQQYLGSIDEVAMYNRELSADEVMAIFQNGVLSTCQPEVTSVRIVQLQLVGDDFVEVGEVSDVAVGDFFTIEVDVTNRGSTPVHVGSPYGWTLSGQGHAEVVQVQLMLCAALFELQPGESKTLRPFCGGKAFEATTAGWTTMDFTVGDCHRTFHFEIQPEATPACQPEVTSVRIVRLQPVGDHFEEVGNVSTVAVGDYFTIKVQVTNRGTTPVPRPLSYKATLSGQGDADVVGDYPRCLGLAMPPLQPGESVTLEPFCWGKAFQATAAGPVTMDIGIDTCHQPFRFEIQPQATPACQPEVTGVRIVQLQPVADHFEEVGEVSGVAVGDYFTIRVEVTNRGSTPVREMNLYGWTLSGQGDADVVSTGISLCAALLELQPGESMTLIPFCGVSNAFQATTAGWATMDFTVGDCHRTFHFEIQPEY